MEKKSFKNMDFSLTFINVHASVHKMENNTHTVLSFHQSCFSLYDFASNFPSVKFPIFSKPKIVKMKNQTENISVFKPK